MQPIVVVLDLRGGDAMRESFERIRQAFERLAVTVVSTRRPAIGPTLEAIGKVASAELKQVRDGIDATLLDLWPRRDAPDLGAILRDLKAFAAERAPRYPKHDVPNALLRQWRGDMLRASCRPAPEWMAGHARRAIRRVHRHKRRT
jgi:hypothetical protein